MRRTELGYRHRRHDPPNQAPPNAPCVLHRLAPARYPDRVRRHPHHPHTARAAAHGGARGVRAGDAAHLARHGGNIGRRAAHVPAHAGGRAPEGLA